MPGDLSSELSSESNAVERHMPMDLAMMDFMTSLVPP